MKKIKLILSVMLLAIFSISMLAGCFGGNDDSGNNGGNGTNPDGTQKTTYTVQYSDDVETYTFEVQAGELFTIPVVPTKSGAEFLGLYDAPQGGNQIVNKNGNSSATYDYGKDMVLYPQFRSYTYTVVLNYQGAEMTGPRELTVKYGDQINNLPQGLVMENKEFTGWYTRQDRKGHQVADEYGPIPGKNIVNTDNFDMTEGNGYIYLYAGFRGEMHTVTLNFDGGYREEVEVEHGTHINDVIYNTRVDGNGVYRWSTTYNDTTLENVFSGKVNGDMVLYATTYAPILQFETNGGEQLSPIVMPAGNALTLPKAVKENYVFKQWLNGRDEPVNINVMPSKSTTIFADWQSQIVFDTRGGSDVDNIVQDANSKIDLPTTSKNGYVFAGWYTKDGNVFKENFMPSESVVLQAKYYKALTKEKVFLSADKMSSVIDSKSAMFFTNYKINFSEEISEINWESGVGVKLDFRAQIRHYTKGNYYDDPLYATKEHIGYYSHNQASDSYLLDKTILNHGNNQINANWTRMNWSVSLQVPTSGMLYLGFSSDKNTENSGWNMTDFAVTISYPDTSRLY